MSIVFAQMLFFAIGRELLGQGAHAGTAFFLLEADFFAGRLAGCGAASAAGSPVFFVLILRGAASSADREAAVSVCATMVSSRSISGAISSRRPLCEA